MESFISQAFHEVVQTAEETEEWYVVLIESVPFYGGPEEGGWWGRDRIVVAFKQYPSRKIAEAIKEKVEKFAQELAEDSQREYGKQCLREMDWLDARGLDADFLPEPDGPSEYEVIVVNEIPQNHYGHRGYE